MIIHGREIHFRRTVGAQCDIAEYSPDGDVNRFDDLINSDNYLVSQKAVLFFICTMSKWYEKEQKENDPEYIERPLTVDECMTLAPDVIEALSSEASAAFSGETVTVEAEEPKQKGKNATGDSE